ncbi:Mor transcription activator family protein [Variovorax atrisoli]|uniref:Mor transcription activator family protein n=2 Tax=Variovorax atrisoli TaxID=3394203 RepID=UPI0011A2819D
MSDVVPPADEPLAIIEEEACAVARCFGIPMPEAAAASLVDRIVLRLGGAHVYLPKKTPRERDRIRTEIFARFNGRNLHELARDYEITPRHLRRILAANKKP